MYPVLHSFSANVPLNADNYHFLALSACYTNITIFCPFPSPFPLFSARFIHFCNSPIFFIVL